MVKGLVRASGDGKGVVVVGTAAMLGLLCFPVVGSLGSSGQTMAPESWDGLARQSEGLAAKLQSVIPW